MTASHQSQINCITFVLYFQLHPSALPLISATTEMFHTSAFSSYSILKTSPQNNNNKKLQPKNIFLPPICLPCYHSHETCLLFSHKFHQRLLKKKLTEKHSRLLLKKNCATNNGIFRVIHIYLLLSKA